jgi:hypothetical protein
VDVAYAVSELRGDIDGEIRTTFAHVRNTAPEVLDERMRPARRGFGAPA